MNISFPVSASGLQAASLRHDVTANNVANVNTDGFESSSIVFKDNNPGTSAAAIRRKPNISPNNTSNTDLSKEMPDMSISKTAYGANAAVIKTQSEMTGEILDLFG